MRRTPLRSRPRAAAPALDREQRLAERAARVMEQAMPRAAAMAHVDAPAAPVHKERPIRSEAYRRAVASLPCIFCGVVGYSQAAHVGPKGASIKACDLTCIPACCTREGEIGCHMRLDQHAMYPQHVRRALAPAWVADTQRRIQAMGLWPSQVPHPRIGEDVAKMQRGAHATPLVGTPRTIAREGDSTRPRARLEEKVNQINHED